VKVARANNSLYHTAVCADARVGRIKDALKMWREAMRSGYEHLERL